MRAAVVSIDPKTGGVKAYYGGSDANGFDFAQAGSADRVVVQGVRVDRRAAAGHRLGHPGGQLAAGGQRHQDHQRRGRRLRHLQHRRGAEALAEHQLLPADAEAEERPGRRRRRRARGGYRRKLPRCRAHAVRGRQGRPAEQRNRVGPVPDPAHRHGLGICHHRRLRRLPRSRTSCRRSSTPTARCCSTPPRRTAPASSASTRPSPTTSSLRCSRSPATPRATTSRADGRRAAKTGTTQLGDTDANKDAWMVGFTPSLSTAVWVGTANGDKPLENKWGSPVCGSTSAV